MNTTIEISANASAQIEIRWYQTGRGDWMFTFSATYNDRDQDFYANTFNEGLIDQIHGLIFDGEKDEALEVVTEEFLNAYGKLYNDIEQWAVQIDAEEIAEADQDAADMEATYNSLNSQFTTPWNA